ncbi:MAG TPA: hypothetical protein VEK07_20850 [Polyangiaceae bacterium]|nr:hypothetical protein [Polyangiaceae bacterium]
MNAIDHAPVPPVQVARAHAAFAPRDEREHAQFEIDLGARDELGELGVRENQPFLSNLPHLRHSHRGDRVVLDELILQGRSEQPIHDAANVGDRPALEPLRGRFVENAPNMRRADVAQGQPSDRIAHVPVEVHALVFDGYEPLCFALG